MNHCENALCVGKVLGSLAVDEEFIRFKLLFDIMERALNHIYDENEVLEGKQILMLDCYCVDGVTNSDVKCKQ